MEEIPGEIRREIYATILEGNSQESTKDISGITEVILEVIARIARKTRKQQMDESQRELLEEFRKVLLEKSRKKVLEASPGAIQTGASG